MLSLRPRASCSQIAKQVSGPRPLNDPPSHPTPNSQDVAEVGRLGPYPPHAIPGLIRVLPAGGSAGRLRLTEGM